MALGQNDPDQNDPGQEGPIDKIYYYFIYGVILTLLAQGAILTYIHYNA